MKNGDKRKRPAELAASQTGNMEEERLRRAGEEWRITLDAITNPVSLLTTKGKIQRCNIAMAKFLGKPFEEIIGQSCYELMQAASASIEGCPVERMLATHQRETLLLQLPGRYFKISAEPVFDDSGGIIGAVHIMTDVTEQNKVVDAIRQERDLSDRIMETSPIGITLVNRRGEITFANAEAERILILKKEQTADKAYRPPDWRFTDYDGNPFPLEKIPFRQAMTTCRPVRDLRLAVEWPDGKRVLLSINAAPLFSSSDQFDGMVATVQDVTKEVQMERKLQESEANYRNLVEFYPGMIAIQSEEKLAFMNIGGLKILGTATTEDVIGKTTMEFIHPDYRKTIIELIQEAIETGIKTENVRLKLLRLDGTAIDVEGMANPAFYEGKPALQFIVHDITECMRAEELLRQSEERFREFFENEPVYGYMISPEGIILDLNRAALTTLGYTKEELLGRHWKMIYTPESQTKAKQRIPYWLETGIVKDEELSIVTKQGERRIVLLSVNMVKDSAGQILYSLAVQEDITEIRNAEESLRKANRTLTALSACNSAMVHVDSEPELLDEICRIVVEIGGYRLAWVGFPEEDERKTMRVAAQAGYEEELLKDSRITWGDTKRGRGPITKTILTGIPHICKNILDEPYYTPWREMAIKSGYASSILLPLNVAGRTFGTLNIYAGETDAFDQEEVKLLMELADDLAYGITALRTRAERERTEKALEESEKRYAALFESAAEGILVVDTETRNIKYANPSLSNIMGYDEQELKQMPFDALVPEDLLEDLVSLFYVHARGEKMFSSEVPFLRKDGEIIYADVKTLPVLQGKSTEIIGLFSDVTPRKRMEEEQKRSAEKLLKAMESTIEAMSATVETRDPYTAGHQRRVSILAVAIAKEMELSEDQVRGIRMAGIVHDIGKIYVPAEILSKPGRLSEVEFSLIKTHPQVGYNILKDIDFPWPIAQIILQHHERINGSGYPAGLFKEAILLEAQIIAVADVIEAMASHRPYRVAIGLEPAMEEISKNSGILYDAAVVDVCTSLFLEKGFKFE